MPESFDISAFQGRPAPSWFDQMAGVCELGWVQLWGLGPNGNGPNPDAEYQLWHIRRIGRPAGGYIVVYPDNSDDTSQLVSTALDAAGPERGHLAFVAPDVEPEGSLRMERLVNCRQQIKWQTSGKLTPLYTSREYWTRAFGSPDVPWPYASEDPLIEARYAFASGLAPDTPPYLDWVWIPFGGWTQRAMLQYAGTVDAFGVGVDRSVFDYQRMKLQEDDMPISPQEWQQIATSDNNILTLFNTFRDDVLNVVGKLDGRLKGVEGGTGGDLAQELADIKDKLDKAAQALKASPPGG